MALWATWRDKRRDGGGGGVTAAKTAGGRFDLARKRTAKTTAEGKKRQKGMGKSEENDRKEGGRRSRRRRKGRRSGRDDHAPCILLASNLQAEGRPRNNQVHVLYACMACGMTTPSVVYSLHAFCPTRQCHHATFAAASENCPALFCLPIPMPSYLLFLALLCHHRLFTVSTGQ